MRVARHSTAQVFVCESSSGSHRRPALGSGGLSTPSTAVHSQCGTALGSARPAAPTTDQGAVMMHSMPFPQLPLDEPDFFAPLRFSAHGGLPQQGLSMGLGAAHRCLADLQLGPFERPYGEGCVSNSSTLDGADPESAVFEGPSNMLLVQRQSNGGGRRGGPPALPPPPSHLFHQAASARSLTGAALPSSPFEPAAAFPQRPHCAASSGNSGGSRCLQQLPSAPSSADVTMLPSHRAPPSPFGPPLPLQLPFSAAALGAPSSGGLLPGSSGGRRPRANEWVSSGGQGADEPAAGWGEPGRFGAAALAGAADQGDAHAGFVADASSHQQQLVPYGASSALPASSFTPLGAESFLGDFTARQSHRAFGEDHVGAGGAGVGSVRQQAIFGECSNRPGSLQRGLLVQQRAEVPGGGGFAEQQVLMLQQHQQRQQQHGRPGNGSSNSSNSTAFARCTTASVAANSSRSNGGGSSTNSSTATCSTTTTFTTTTTSSSSSSAGERRTLGRATHRLGGSSATLDDPFGWSQAAASGGSGGIGGVCNTSMDLGRLAATTRPHNFSNSSPFGVFDSAPSHRSNGGGAAAAAGAWAPTPMPPPMPMPTMSTGGAGAGGSTRPLLQEARDAATTATSCPLPCLPPGLLLPGVISAALDGPQPGTAQPAAATARPTIDWESLPAATAAADDAGPCSGASVKSCGSTVVGGDAAAMLAAGKHSPAVDPSRSLLRRTVTPPALLPTLQLPATPPQGVAPAPHQHAHQQPPASSPAVSQQPLHQQSTLQPPQPLSRLPRHTVPSLGSAGPLVGDALASTGASGMGGHAPVPPLALAQPPTASATAWATAGSDATGAAAAVSVTAVGPSPLPPCTPSGRGGLRPTPRESFGGGIPAARLSGAGGGGASVGVGGGGVGGSARMLGGATMPLSPPAKAPPARASTSGAMSSTGSAVNASPPRGRLSGLMGAFASAFGGSRDRPWY